MEMRSLTINMATSLLTEMRSLTISMATSSLLPLQFILAIVHPKPSGSTMSRLFQCSMDCPTPLLLTPWPPPLHYWLIVALFLIIIILLLFQFPLLSSRCPDGKEESSSPWPRPSPLISLALVNCWVILLVPHRLWFFVELFCSSFIFQGTIGCLMRFCYLFCLLFNCVF